MTTFTAEVSEVTALVMVDAASSQIPQDVAANVAFTDAPPEAQTAFAVTLSSAIALSMTASSAFSEQLREQLSISTPVSPSFTYHLEVASALVTADLVLTGMPAAVAEALVLSCADAISRGVVVAEALGLTSLLAVSGIYGRMVTQSLHVVDLFRNYFGAEIADAVVMAATLIETARMAAEASDVVTVAVDPTPLLILQATMADTLDITIDTALSMLFTAEVLEGITLDLAYVSPGSGVTTWAMNTMTGAVTEYQNYDFNSFTAWDGTYYGASATGLYELRGGTDDGADVIARLKGGFLQFGGTKLSRLKEAYVAARGDGGMLLKIIAADDDVYVYQLDARNMRSTKVNMGKGQRCRYFAYELITAGQEFELDNIEFVPIVVTRRV